MMTYLGKFAVSRPRRGHLLTAMICVVALGLAERLQAQAPPRPPAASNGPMTLSTPPMVQPQVQSQVLAPTQPQVQASPAQRPIPSKFVESIDDSTERLELTVNSSRRLKLAEPFPNVVVNNPDIVSATPVSDTEILIYGRRAGVTQMIFETKSGAMYNIDVIVLADAAEVNMILKKLYPRANVDVVAFASTAVVSGYVDDPTLVTPVMQTVQEFFPTAINGIQVGGGQQVLVKVKIMEVSRTKLRTLGVDWVDITGSGDFFGSSISGMLRAASLGAVAPIVSTTGAQTFQFGVIDAGNSFFGFLEALRQHDIAKILADPEVVAISGRPAYFNSGGEIPIIVPQSLGTVSIEYRPYGTQVDFVPIIRNNGTIRLEIRPRVSELDAAHSVTINGTTVPALTSRTVDTGVEMRAGQTLAIAGLVQQRVEGFNRGIPYLSEIPYLGVPFRRVREQVNEVELVILVTPYLVEAGELPCTGPGMNTIRPTDRQLYGLGEVEVPAPIMDDSMGGPLGPTGPVEMVEPVAPGGYPLPPPENDVPPAAKTDAAASSAPRVSGSARLSGPAKPVIAASSAAPASSMASAKPASAEHNRQDRATANPPAAGSQGDASSLPGYYGPVGYDDLK